MYGIVIVLGMLIIYMFNVLYLGMDLFMYIVINVGGMFVLVIVMVIVLNLIVMYGLFLFVVGMVGMVYS